MHGNKFQKSSMVLAVGSGLAGHTMRSKNVSWAALQTLRYARQGRLPAPRRQVDGCKDCRRLCQAKRRAQIGREIRSELRDIERDAIASGALAKDWRDLFK